MLTQLHVVVGHTDPVVLPASGVQPAGAWPAGHSWCCGAHRKTDWRFRSKLHHRQWRMGVSLDLVACCWPNYMSSHCPISTVPVNKTEGKLCVIVGHTGKWPLNTRLWLGAWLMYICIASVFHITTSLYLFSSVCNGLRYDYGAGMLSVLWRCWLGGRKGFWSVKTSGGVLALLSVWS